MALAVLLLPSAAAARVRTGIDVLEQTGFKQLRGRRICLITNQTGVDSAGRGDVEVLAAAEGVALACLFTPEHGFTGASEENRIEDGSLVAGGRKIPIYSLYKDGMGGMKPKPAQLAGTNALVFDIQDIGSRFYTYLASMAMAMEAARDAGLEFFVLDRPNPIGGEVVEGPILEGYKQYRKTVPTGYFPVPIRHGMTAGEMATLYAAELGYKKLHVVKLRGWSRSQWLDETGLPGWDNDRARRPSPNIPDLEAAALYPGLALFEPSNLSIGRGVEGSQFRLVGAPWLDAGKVLAELGMSPQPGAAFAAEDFTPSGNPAYPYHGQPCRGIRVKITDRKLLRPAKIFLALAQAIRTAHPDKVQWRFEHMAIMTGLRDFERLYKTTPDLNGLGPVFDAGAKSFERIRRPYLLY